LKTGNYYGLALSPAGDRLVMGVSAANDKIWAYDLERRTLSRITSTPGNDGASVWSPDGASIVYSNDRSGPWDIYVMPSDGSEAARPILANEFDKFAMSWSPDGRTVAIEQATSDGNQDIMMIDMDTGDVRPFVATSNNEGLPRFSPNGRAVAYFSDVSGADNVYVRPFPGPGQATRISRSGSYPFWSRDGSELYYAQERRDGDGDVELDAWDLMVVEVSWEPDFRASDPKRLLALPVNIYGVIPTTDKERFIAVLLDSDRATQHQIRIVFDWTRQLNDTQ